MINKLKTNRILWLTVACLSLIASLAGVFNQDLYGRVLDSKWLPGTIAQDVITIIAALVLLFLSLKMEDAEVIKQIAALSILAYLFYGYGIYVIEQLYTPLYLLYVAVCGLSFWSVIYGSININQEELAKIKASKLADYLTAGFLFIVSLLFYLLWTSQIIPLMREGQKLEFTFSIYILDMVFVLPALIIIGTLIIRGNPAGLFFAPVLMSLKAFTLLFSVGLGGLLKPLYNQSAGSGETAFYFSLSAVFLALAVFGLRRINFGEASEQ